MSFIEISFHDEGFDEKDFPSALPEEEAIYIYYLK